MEFTAKAIAQLLNGTIEGNPDVCVSTLSKIEEGQPGSLSFLANMQYKQYLYTTNASIVIVNKDFKPEKDVKSTLIRVDNAYQAFAKLLELYNKQKTQQQGIHPQVFIENTAVLGNNIFIGAFTYIGNNVKIGNNVRIYPQVYLGDNVEINDNTIIYSGVKIYNESKIGARCILHSGVIIGSDGFGFAIQNNKQYKKIPQVGNVIIEDDVEIGANTTIDRATLGSTIIKKGAKLDNLIQIAHNVKIGENTAICAQTGISGSTSVGNNCMIAGQVGIVGHLSIADNVKIGAQSGVSKSIIEPNVAILGSPAFNATKYNRSFSLFKRLPELFKKITELENTIKQLTKK